MGWAGVILTVAEKAGGLEVAVCARGDVDASAPVMQMAADIGRAWVSRDRAAARPCTCTNCRRNCPGGPPCDPTAPGQGHCS